jgi:hypothetical protein
VPVLVMHGDDDQIARYADSAPQSAKLLRNSTLKTYKGFPHSMPTTEADTIKADLLTFLKGASTTAAAQLPQDTLFSMRRLAYAKMSWPFGVMAGSDLCSPLPHATEKIGIFLCGGFGR